MLRRIITLALAALALGAITSRLHSLHAGGKEEQVKITFKAGKADAAGKQAVIFHLDIQPDWYIYANPVGDESFEANKVQVKAKGASIKVEYPKAQTKTDVLDGKELRYFVHKGKVEIKAELQRDANADKVKVTVHYNACNAKTGICLLPARKEFTIP